VSLVVRHGEEFTTVRRDNDGWVLGSVHRSRSLEGWSVLVVCPLGVRDGQLYQTEADAVAAIGRHQFTVVRTVTKDSQPDDRHAPASRSSAGPPQPSRRRQARA
jgi:hypothetical protein